MIARAVAPPHFARKEAPAWAPGGGIGEARRCRFDAQDPGAGGKLLTLRVADPEFFIDFEFADKDPVTLVSAPSGCVVTVAKPTPLGASDKQKLTESFFTNLAPGTNFGFKMASAAIVACP